MSVKPRNNKLVFADALLLILAGAAAVSDVKSRKIRNWLVYPAIVAGITNALFINGLQGAGESLLGMTAGAVPLIPFFLFGGIGAGDVKLAAAAGAIKGWSFALSGIFLGSIAAAIYCLVLLVKTGNLRKTLAKVRNFIIFALALKTIVPIDDRDSVFIPFGFFLCAGFGAVETGTLLNFTVSPF